MSSYCKSSFYTSDRNEECTTTMKQKSLSKKSEMNIGTMTIGLDDECRSFQSSYLKEGSFLSTFSPMKSNKGNVVSHQTKTNHPGNSSKTKKINMWLSPTIRKEPTKCIKRTCLYRPWDFSFSMGLHNNNEPATRRTVIEKSSSPPRSLPQTTRRYEKSVPFGNNNSTIKISSPPRMNRTMTLDGIIESTKTTTMTTQRQRPPSTAAVTVLSVTETPVDGINRMNKKTRTTLHGQHNLPMSVRKSDSSIDGTFDRSDRSKHDEDIERKQNSDPSTSQQQQRKHISPYIQPIGNSRLQLYKSVPLVGYFPSTFYDHIVQATEAYATNLPRGWQTRKLYSLTQQDIAICDVPGGWDVTWLLTKCILSIVKTLYHQTVVYMDRNQPHVLKYDCDDEVHCTTTNTTTITTTNNQEKMKSRGVRLHCDRCNVTVNIALNRTSDYTGGGTYIQELDRIIKLEQGEILFHPGDLVHGGSNIRSGTRYLLVYFIQFGPLPQEQQRNPKVFPF